jgi:hypothetical protein
LGGAPYAADSRFATKTPHEAGRLPPALPPLRALALGFLVAAPAAHAVEGAASAELTLGRQFALNASFELSPILDRLWLVAGYGLLKSPNVPESETTPRVTTAASHLFSLGADFSPHKSWLFSVLAQASPRSGETVRLSPRAPPCVLTTPFPDPDDAGCDPAVMSLGRQTAGGAAAIAFDTAGDSAFELGLDAGLGFNWNGISRTLTLNREVQAPRSASLFVTRPQLGVAVVIKGTVTLAVRAGYTFYSADPLSVTRLEPDELRAIVRTVAPAVDPDTLAGLLADAERLGTDLSSVHEGANTALRRLSTFDAMSGYPYAPVLFDLKASVLVRFSRRFSMQLAWTYLRYVPSEGFGNVAALKAQLRVGGGWRAWIAGAAQFDKAPEEPRAAVSGHLSFGAEFAF